VKKYVENEEAFCFTYGDGVSDVDIAASIRFHRAHGKLGTMTAVQPPGRFGAIDIDGQRIERFKEKPQGDGNWINGGYFVLSPKVIDRIAEDGTYWEREPMEGLARDGQIDAYLHHGFWQPMDTLRDKVHLEELWQSGQAPWKRWP
jgi:glucose-1-phosphate cytidylyltransferase